MASLRGIAFSSGAVSSASARASSPLMVTSEDDDRPKRRSVDLVQCTTCKRKAFPRSTAKCAACQERSCGDCLFVCCCGHYYCVKCVPAHAKVEADWHIAKGKRDAQCALDEAKEFVARVTQSTSSKTSVQEVAMANS